MGFALVEQKLADVRQTLGAAEMRETGHDGGGERRLGYYFGASRTQVTLKTSELGGQEQHLLDVELAPNGGYRYGAFRRRASALDGLG